MILLTLQKISHNEDYFISNRKNQCEIFARGD